MNPSLVGTKRFALYLTAFAPVALAIAGCTPATVPPGSVGLASTAAPPLQTVGQILNSDPRFADYAHVIDFAGLSHRIDDARGVTIFAPTNAAFAHADPNWGATAVPDTNDNDWAGKRQKLIEQSVLDGVHPPAQFAGKVQDVRALDGSIFHIDGRQPGAISITTGAAPSHLMGAASKAPAIAKAQIPPIFASDGIVYPVDNILIQ